MTKVDFTYKLIEDYIDGKIDNNLLIENMDCALIDEDIIMEALEIYDSIVNNSISPYQSYAIVEAFKHDLISSEVIECLIGYGMIDPDVGSTLIENIEFIKEGKLTRAIATAGLAASMAFGSPAVKFDPNTTNSEHILAQKEKIDTEKAYADAQHNKEVKDKLYNNTKKDLKSLADKIFNKSRDLAHKAVEVGSKAADASKKAFGETKPAAEKMVDASKNVMDKASELGHKAMDATKPAMDKASEFGGKAVDVSKDAGHKAFEMGKNLMNKASSMSKSAMDKASELGHKAMDASKNLGSKKNSDNKPIEVEKPAVEK